MGRRRKKSSQTNVGEKKEDESAEKGREGESFFPEKKGGGGVTISPTCLGKRKVPAGRRKEKRITLVLRKKREVHSIPEGRGGIIESS